MDIIDAKNGTEDDRKRSKQLENLRNMKAQLTDYFVVTKFIVGFVPFNNSFCSSSKYSIVTTIIFLKKMQCF